MAYEKLGRLPEALAAYKFKKCPGGGSHKAC
jgi:hypothetical protein